MKIARLFVSLPIGVVLVVVGIIIWFTVNTAIKDRVIDAAVLLPENDKSEEINPWTRFYSNLEDSNNQRLYEYYVYNLTNPQETMAGEYPIFQELGPYKYNLMFEKLNVTFLDDEKIVSFQDWTYYVPRLDDETSKNPNNDMIYQVNLAYVTILQMYGGEKNFALILAGSTFNQLVAQFQTPSLSVAIGTIGGATVLNTIFGNVAAYFTATNPTGDSFYTACRYWGGDTSITFPPASTLPQGFLFNGTESLDLTEPVCQSLFNSSKAYSLTNSNADTGYGAWLKSLTNPTLTTQIYTYMNATSPDDTFTKAKFDSIVVWMTKFRTTTTLQTLLAKQPTCAPIGTQTCTTADIAKLQWGTKDGLLQGNSLGPILGISGFVPEFGIGQDIDLTLTQISYLWNSANKFSLMTPQGVAGLAALVATNNTAVVSAQTGGVLNLQEAASIITYMFGFVKNIAYPKVIAAGGGLITHQTVNNYLFHYQDPILVSNYPADPLKQNAAIFKNYTRQEAGEVLPLDQAYTGKDDAVLTQCPLTFNGETFIQYAEKLPIEGHNSENIGPYYLANNDFDIPVDIFSEEYARTLHFYREKTDNLKGLRYFRYRIKDLDWIANSTLFQSIDYLMNLTTASGAPVYPSRPRLKGIDPKYLIRAGLDDFYADEEDNDIYADFEPSTGKAISGRKSIQINYFVEGTGPNKEIATKFGFFNNVTGDVIYPVVWAKTEVVANQDQIDLLLTSHKVDSVRYALTIILIVIGSMIVISVIGLYVLDHLAGKGFFDEK